eukprot:13542568-Alexandrium_andersonii.AAC.1
MLNLAVENATPISQSSLAERARAISANLYTLLAMKMRAKALTVVKLAPPGNGFEAWRLLKREYRPRGDEPEHAMLSAIVQPRWWSSQDHRGRNFNDLLIDWEGLIAKYEMESSELISDSLKCATIL